MKLVWKRGLIWLLGGACVIMLLSSIATGNIRSGIWGTLMWAFVMIALMVTGRTP